MWVIEMQRVVYLNIIVPKTYWKTQIINKIMRHDDKWFITVILKFC